MNNDNKIKKVKCRRVFDSRGNPAIEVEIHVSNNIYGRAISPSGASTGSREAIEKRDNDNNYMGKDVKNGLKIIEEKISPLLIGQHCNDQKNFDDILLQFDNSSQKENIGGNVSSALSIANYLCASKLSNNNIFKYDTYSENLKLPRPEIQIFGGGAHSGNNKSFQDFLIYPVGEFNLDDFFNNAHSIFYKSKKIIESNNNFYGYCDEGGLYPNNLNQYQICDVINQAIVKSNLNPGKDIGISIDVAATNFYKNGKYFIYENILDTQDLDTIYANLISNYNVSMIEDPYNEKDFDSFKKLKSVSKSAEIIGDDLTCTNLSLLKEAITFNAIDGIIIKINQCGTISETLEVLKLAKENNLKTILSARSGDTEDCFLSQLSVAWKVDMIKVGSITRSERTSKWNELIRINELLNKN